MTKQKGSKNSDIGVGCIIAAVLAFSVLLYFAAIAVLVKFIAWVVAA